MITFKNFLRLEARKNSNVNVKKSINDNLYDYYIKSPELHGKKNAFVSFTELEKLGINPQSEYNTPLGIYAYPIEYVLNKIGKNASMSDMEFQGDAPYANAFNAKGNIIDVKRVNRSDYKNYLTKIKEYWKKSFTNLTQEYMDSYLHGYSENGEYEGFLLWKITRDIAKRIGQKTGKDPSLVWNNLFISIGIDGVVDYGNGRIHPNEPTQAVFFHIKAVKNVELFDNKYSPVDVAVGDEPLERSKYDIGYDYDDEGDDKSFWAGMGSQNINAPSFPSSSSKKQLTPKHSSSVKRAPNERVPNETEQHYNQRMLNLLKDSPLEYRNIQTNHALNLMFVKARPVYISYVEEVIGQNEELELAAIAANSYAFHFMVNPTFKAQVAALKADPVYAKEYFFVDNPEKLKAALKAAHS